MCPELDSPLPEILGLLLLSLLLPPGVVIQTAAATRRGHGETPYSVRREGREGGSPVLLGEIQGRVPL